MHLDHHIIEASFSHRGVSSDSPHLRDYLRRLPSLTALDLTGNRCVCIPNLTWCKDIRALNLSHNFVANKTLFSPLNRPRLRMLVELRLSHNKVTSLRGFGAAPNLHYLDVSFNQISNLNGLEDMSQIRTLLMTNNEVKGGLIAFTALCNLTELSLAQNPVARKGGLYKAALMNYCPHLSRFDGQYLSRSTRTSLAQAHSSPLERSPDCTDDNINSSGYSHNGSYSVTSTSASASASSVSPSRQSVVARQHQMKLRSKGSPGYSQLHERAMEKERRKDMKALNEAVYVKPYPLPNSKSTSTVASTSPIKAGARGRPVPSSPDSSPEVKARMAKTRASFKKKEKAVDVLIHGREETESCHINDKDGNGKRCQWLGTSGRAPEDRPKKKIEGLNPFPLRKTAEETPYQRAIVASEEEDSNHTVFSSAIMTQDLSEVTRNSSFNEVDARVFLSTLPHSSDQNLSTTSNIVVSVEDSPTGAAVASRRVKQYERRESEGSLRSQPSQLPWRQPPNPLPRQFKGQDVALVDHDELLHNEMVSPNRYRMKNCLERVKADKLDLERRAHLAKKKHKWLSPDLSREASSRHVASSVHDRPLEVGHPDHLARFFDMTTIGEYENLRHSRQDMAWGGEPGTEIDTETRVGQKSQNKTTSFFRTTKIAEQRAAMARSKRGELEERERREAQLDGRDMPDDRHFVVEPQLGVDEEAAELEDLTFEDGPAAHTRSRHVATDLPPLPAEAFPEVPLKEGGQEEEDELQQKYEDARGLDLDNQRAHDSGAAEVAEYRRLEALAYFADGDADIIDDLNSSISGRLERARKFNAALSTGGLVERREIDFGEGDTMIVSSVPTSVSASYDQEEKHEQGMDSDEGSEESEARRRRYAFLDSLQQSLDQQSALVGDTPANEDNLHVSSDGGDDDHDDGSADTVAEADVRDAGEPSPQQILARLEKLKNSEHLDDIGELEQSYDTLLSS